MLPLHTSLALASSFLLVLAMAGCATTSAVAPEPAAAPTATPTAASAPTTAADTSAALAAVLAGPHRSEANKARDVYRHPAETLAFFGLARDMTVVEIWPGGGWYTEVLAPVLKEKGRYYAAGFEADTDSDYRKKSLVTFGEKLAASPDLYGSVVVTELGAKKLEVAPPGSADLVLTFRNVHNWMSADFADAAFVAMYAALKPGGVLGVVEHRAGTEAPQDPKAVSGYVREDHVIAMAEKAGFKLVDRSEINANAKDTRDHPKGVWTLPPALRLEGVDREKYVAIGESDRMTLKFVKPQ
ncbi:MAG: methyltransferase [Myxococcota bacterium]